MRKWVVEAEALADVHRQRDLFLEVSTNAADPKTLDNNVFILEDDGSVATFSVASPQTEISTAAVVAPDDSAQVSETIVEATGHSESIGTDLFSPNSIATSASSFVRHLNELVEGTEPALAAISTFPHPRVGNSTLGEDVTLRHAEGQMPRNHGSLMITRCDKAGVRIDYFSLKTQRIPCLLRIGPAPASGLTIEASQKQPADDEQAVVITQPVTPPNQTVSASAPAAKSLKKQKLNSADRTSLRHVYLLHH